MRKILFILFLVIISVSLSARDKSSQTSLYSLQKVHEFRSSNPDSALIIVDSLWRKSKIDEFSNIQEAELAYAYGMVCARANQARQSIKFLLIAHSSDSTNPNFEATVCSALSEQYMFLGEYERSLSFALKAYEQALKAKDRSYLPTCLAVIGNVYSQMKMFEKAHSYLDKAIEAANNIEDQILFQYVKGDVYAQERKFDTSAFLMQKLLNELNNLSEKELSPTYYKNPIELSYFKAELLSQMAYSLIMSNSPQKAQKACQEAMQLIHPIAQIRMPVYLNLFNYMKEAKRWSLLITEVKRILPKIEMGDSINNYNYTLINFLSEAYFGLGDYKTAYLYRTEAANLNEHLTEKMKTAAALELGAVYETGQKDAQILTQKYVIQTQRNRLIIMIAVLILFGSILVSTYYNLQRINRKNKKLFEQINLLNEKEAQLSNFKNIQTDFKGNSENKGNLFCEMESFLESSQEYLAPDINRKTLANKLSTNETYLCNAIREATGLSFQNYIYGLRLDIAQKRLLNQSDKATIESIALDCGFNSSRNFNRLFRDKFGMAPTEFKKLALLYNNPKES